MLRNLMFAVLYGVACLSIGTSIMGQNRLSLVTINSSGTSAGNAGSFFAGSTVSADGKWVVFESPATDLVVVNDTNGQDDIFARNLQTGQTILVSSNRFGTGTSNLFSQNAKVSADGRYVAFDSYSTDLVANDTNAFADVYVRDLLMGTTTLVSRNTMGTNGGNDDSGDAGGATRNLAISGDGRYVFFVSEATDLVSTPDFNGHGTDVFMRDMVNGTTVLISINTAGSSSGNSASGASINGTVVITPDGRFVVFGSGASDLVTNDTNGAIADLFVRDMMTGTTSLLTLNSAGTGSGNANTWANGDLLTMAISDDGRFVAFNSRANNLVTNDTNGSSSDVFVRDRTANTTILVSINSSNTASGNGSSFSPSMSSDGRYVAFEGIANNLVASGDTNGNGDVFVRDLQSGTTRLVSVNIGGVNSGNAESTAAIISNNGKTIVFRSIATNLTNIADDILSIDVFVRNLQAGVTSMITINSSGSHSANNLSTRQGISADGRLIIFWSLATDLTTIPDTNNGNDLFAVRISPSSLSDFDGDGKTDVSVFRASSGYWYISNSSNGSFRADAFGTAGDRIVPADFDGDGKTDVAVWRPSTGYWYRLDSSNGAFRSTVFGQNGDMPAPGDYDGDGKSDICVLRPSIGTFYLLYSSDSSFHFQQWGQAGDVPVVGDYDGDGKSDFGIYRDAISIFYYLRSSDGGVRGFQWGASGDKPIAGDFDADGKTDIAVYRPSTGAWYSIRSSDNALIGVGWGTTGDVPAAGDYDGDGKLDVAVFRPSTGIFYILQSTNGALRAEQFGTNGDLPTPSAFVP